MIHYKSEREAMKRVNRMKQQGIWTCTIRKVDVDGKVYYVLGFDPDPDQDEL